MKKKKKAKKHYSPYQIMTRALSDLDELNQLMLELSQLFVITFKNAERDLKGTGMDRELREVKKWVSAPTFIAAWGTAMREVHQAGYEELFRKIAKVADPRPLPRKKKAWTRSTDGR